MKKIVYFLSFIVLASCAEESASTDSEIAPSETETAAETSNDEAEQAEVEPEDRIATIKKWYKELVGLQINAKKCKTGKKTTYDGFSTDTEQMPFENSAKYCQLEKGYSYKEGEFNGYEYGKTATFYYKDDKLFFVFTRGGAEAYGYEYRTYYDAEGNVIKVIENANEGDGGELTKTREIKSAEDIEYQAKDNRTSISLINEMLGIK